MGKNTNPTNLEFYTQLLCNKEPGGICVSRSWRVLLALDMKDKSMEVVMALKEVIQTCQVW